MYVITVNDNGHITNARKATKADIGLDQVDNTADRDKPASQAMLDIQSDVSTNALHAADSEVNAQAWATGMRGTTPVSEGDPTWHNNSEYYAEQSAASASAASASEGEAREYARNASASAGSAGAIQTQVIAARKDAQDAATAAQEALSEFQDISVDATTLETGSPAPATYDHYTQIITFGIPRGAKGNKGNTPVISIGTVTTLENGQQATASITNTAEEPVLNLGLPKGNTGTTPDIQLGEIHTVNPGEDVSATITGTAENPILNLWIPKGDTGDYGPFEFGIGTVTSLPSGSQATASFTQNPSGGYLLNLGIPEGNAGNIPFNDNAGVGDTNSLWSADKTARTIEGLIDDSTGEGDMDNTWSANRIIVEVQSLINDNAGDGSTDVTWSADKIRDELDSLTQIDDNAGLGNTDVTWSANKIRTEMNAFTQIDDTAGAGDTDVTWSADKIVNELNNLTQIDDTAGDGDTDVTWSANKIVSELSNLNSVSVSYDSDDEELELTIA